MSFLDKHKVLETNATLLLVCSLLVVSIGGLVQLSLIHISEPTRPY